MKYVDRLRESTTTTGTGTVTLLGAITGYSAIQDGYSVGERVPYEINLGANYEVGLGTLVTTTTLSRDTVLRSSNAGALVNFPAGTKDIFVTLPGTLIADVGTTLGFKQGIYF